MSYIMKTNLARKENYGSKRSVSDIKYIVIHFTANDGDSDESNGNYFHNRIVKASAHYFVDDNSVTQSVPDDHVAYSVGGSKYRDCDKTGGGKLYGVAKNANTLNIELCDSDRNGTIMATEATMENTAELCKVLMSKYGIDADHVIRHFDVNGKHCPAYFMDAAAWSGFKSRLSGSVEASAPTPAPTPAPVVAKPTPAPSNKIDVVHQVYAKEKGWLSEVTNYNDVNGRGYSGWLDYPMLGFRAKTKGSSDTAGYLEYRAHKKGGDWLSWRRDFEKDSYGDTFSGNLKSEIDGLQFRIVGVTGRHVRYRVHAIGKGWLGWITDYGEGSNGYAGMYGHAIDGVKIEVV